jgi:hypothetical protein
MLKQLVAQSLNGFSTLDIPFLILQLSTSALLAFIIRVYWRKAELTDEEKKFLIYLIPLQIALTTLAIFSLQSPWIIVLFGIVTLFPLLGNISVSLRSRFFYMLCVFIAFGCGAANLAVTSLIVICLIIPLLFIQNRNQR